MASEISIRDMDLCKVSEDEWCQHEGMKCSPMQITASVQIINDGPRHSCSFSLKPCISYNKRSTENRQIHREVW